MKVIRLRDVAEAAGVSRMTVSLALRSHPSLPVATRERIKAVAVGMGYQPDPEVSRAMKIVGSKRRERVPATIALVSAQPDSLLHDPGLRSTPLVSGLVNRIEYFGYQLEEFNLVRDKLSPARLSKVLWTRRIAGVIFTAIQRDFDISSFRWEQFIPVEVGTSISEPRIHRACSNHHRSMATALQALWQRGYKRIGLVGGEVTDRLSSGRSYKSFYGEMAYQRLPVEVPPIVLAEDQLGPDFEAWFERYKPDVLLCYLKAKLVIQWLAKRGMRVPEDIGVAHLHLRVSGMEFGEVSGIDQHSNFISKAAVDLMIGKMEANAYGLPEFPEVVTIAGSWVDGGTTRIKEKVG